MVGIRADQAIEPATLRQLTGQLIRGEDKVLSPSAAWYRVNIGADGIDHGEIVGCGIRGGIAKRLLLPLHLAYEAFLRKADRLAAYGAGEGKEQRIGARLFDGQGLLAVQGGRNLEGDLPGFARLQGRGGSAGTVIREFAGGQLRACLRGVLHGIAAAARELEILHGFIGRIVQPEGQFQVLAHGKRLSRKEIKVGPLRPARAQPCLDILLLFGGRVHLRGGFW
mgnify:CR=1 FL=1